MDPFIGEICLFSIVYTPQGWADCDGQILPVSQYSTLFNLLGFTYGGNGKDTFALPDLRGRAVLGAGGGPGLSKRDPGEVVGAETVPLSVSNLPPHNHMVSTFASNTDSKLAEVGDADHFLSRYKVKGVTNVAEHFRSPSLPGPTVDVRMSPVTIGLTGGGEPHDNMQPYLTLRYCIAIEGIYPNRE